MARLENNQDSSSHGGARKGAGRKPGSATKRTREIADKAADEGITPLEFMLNLMRRETSHEDPKVEIAREALAFEAAKAAAPFVHPKLSSIDLKADIATHEASLDDLA